MEARRGEVAGIDSASVTQWFRENIEGAEPPLRFEIIPGGHSNLTYRVGDRAGNVFVLRRPPLGAVVATAHDMAREHRIIAALGPTPVPVPPALGLCEDNGVNDAPFYVMRFVEGSVLVNAGDVERDFPGPERDRIGESVIDVLADLHCVDPDAVGLGDLGRREAYLQRQLRRWRTQWEKTRTRELPLMDEVHQALGQHCPPQNGAAIVHGDYRLGNAITGADGRIAAVLDWELCTLGDPLADLGYLLNNWAAQGEVGPTTRGAALSPSMAGGFPDRAQMVERYARRTGAEVRNVAFYRAFQYWRLGAIVEGVMSRYLKGVMAGEADTDSMRLQVEELAVAARSMIEEL
ncbi:MAG: phosphotransferase family protein [Proteobacteria bacterium]|nr:phosphotransferase family protein [Pseudomonadota bacterium]